MLTKKNLNVEQPPVQKRVFFPNLDGLRFLAFFSVFMFHSFHTEYENILQSETYQVVNTWFSYGDLGVNFFFVLSGFLITYLLLKEEEFKGKIEVPFSYARRFLRIWPLYFFCVLFGFVSFPIMKELLGQAPDETADPVYFLTFLSNINNIKNGMPDASILGVLWSVSIEEQFYFFWPLLVILMKRRRVCLFMTIIISSVIFRYLHYNNHDIIYFHTLSVISDMAVGGFLGWFCFYKKAKVADLSRINRWLVVFVYLIGLSIIIFRKEIFIGALGIAVERVTLSIFFAFIIFEQNYATNYPFKVGNSRWLSQWGKYTYRLYCLHFIGILTSTNISKVIGTNTTVSGVMVWETLLALSISMALAWISYHYFEEYFLQAKKKLAYIAH